LHPIPGGIVLPAKLPPVWSLRMKSFGVADVTEIPELLADSTLLLRKISSNVMNYIFYTVFSFLFRQSK